MLLADLVRAGNSYGNWIPDPLHSGMTGMDPKRQNTSRKRVLKVLTILTVSMLSTALSSHFQINLLPNLPSHPWDLKEHIHLFVLSPDKNLLSTFCRLEVMPGDMISASRNTQNERGMNILENKMPNFSAVIDLWTGLMWEYIGQGRQERTPEEMIRTFTVPLKTVCCWYRDWKQGLLYTTL